LENTILNAFLSRNIVVDRDLPVPMEDGIVLLADRLAPDRRSGPLPTVLLRSPYGRQGVLATVFARPYVRSGFQVVFQSVRGTFGSGGEFEPFRHERADGLATIDWVTRQPWFDGNLVLAGSSYLGYTQWAVADALPPAVKAVIPAVTSAQIIDAFARPEGVRLDTLLRWSHLIKVQENPWRLLAALVGLGERSLRRAASTLPLTDSDRRLLGLHWSFFQQAVTHDSEAKHWAEVDHRDAVAKVNVPVSLVAGWYDFFLPYQLRDYRALVEAGKQPRLTVGPWVHASPAISACGAREAQEWALPLCGATEPAEPDERRAPVRLFVTGREEWQDFDAWPPAGYRPVRWNLGPAGRLGTDPAPSSGPDRYRYDPADPTPAVGGPTFSPRKAGRKDNRRLESRPDVLCYTSPPLERDLEIVGEVTAEIWLRSSRPHTDLFVRVCEVDTRGRSHNICDGIAAVMPDQPIPDRDGVSRVEVTLWPAAHQFRRGQRIRVQISSGAHPAYARNPGSGEPRATATTLHPAEQEIFHDPDRPSAVFLPAREAP